MYSKHHMTISERWRVIFARHYAVSTWARVMRMRPGMSTYQGKIMTPRRMGEYLVVKLCVCGVPKLWYLHRLVAEAFLGPCPRGCCVRWKDGDKTNCKLENLHYVVKKGAKRHDAYAGKNLTKAVWGDFGRNRKHPETGL